MTLGMGTGHTVTSFIGAVQGIVRLFIGARHCKAYPSLRVLGFVGVHGLGFGLWQLRQQNNFCCWGENDILVFSFVATKRRKVQSCLVATTTFESFRRRNPVRCETTLNKKSKTERRKLVCNTSEFWDRKKTKKRSFDSQSEVVLSGEASLGLRM